MVVFFVFGEEEDAELVLCVEDVHVDVPVAPVVEDLRNDVGFLIPPDIEVGNAPDIDMRLEEEAGFFLGDEEEDMATGKSKVFSCGPFFLFG